MSETIWLIIVFLGVILALVLQIELFCGRK